MRHLSLFLVAALLPSAICQADVDADLAEWVKSLLNEQVKSETKINNGKEKLTTDEAENKYNNNNNEVDAAFESCTTDDGANGLCVLYYQCDSRGLIDNTTLIDLRINNCPESLQKCCAISEVTVKPTIPPTKVNKECGWSNPGANILGGRDSSNINTMTYADFGEYPWMIALIKKGAASESWSPKTYIGGGTLIHRSVVITAAHKVSKYSSGQIKCRAGEWETLNTNELYDYQERDVKKIIAHEEVEKHFVRASNDISMLILERPFVLENYPNIGIACLSASLPASGTQCFGMGWGQFKNGSYANILKKVEVPYVDFNTCQTILRKTHLSKKYNLHSSHLCAGGKEGVDTCKGDGGSPLVCPIEENTESQRFSVYGLVAFGVGCGGPVPGVYVNIPRMYSWVESKMIQEGFDPASFKP